LVFLEVLFIGHLKIRRGLLSYITGVYLQLLSPVSYDKKAYELYEGWSCWGTISYTILYLP